MSSPLWVVLVLGSIRKWAEEAVRASKWAAFLHGLCVSSCFQFPAWFCFLLCLHSVICYPIEPNKSILNQVVWLWYFSTIIITLTKIGSMLEVDILIQIFGYTMESNLHEVKHSIVMADSAQNLPSLKLFWVFCSCFFLKALYSKRKCYLSFVFHLGIRNWNHKKRKENWKIAV